MEITGCMSTGVEIHVELIKAQDEYYGSLQCAHRRIHGISSRLQCTLANTLRRCPSIGRRECPSLVTVASSENDLRITSLGLTLVASMSNALSTVENGMDEQTRKSRS